MHGVKNESICHFSVSGGVVTTLIYELLKTKYMMRLVGSSD